VARHRVDQLTRTCTGEERAASLGRMENDKLDEAELVEADEPAIEEELLVEEISIDGMCGVY